MSAQNYRKVLAGTVAAGTPVTIPRSNGGYMVKNNTASTGNVTLTLSDSTTYVLLPGEDLEMTVSFAVDQVVITCAAGATAKYVYFP